MMRTTLLHSILATAVGLMATGCGGVTLSAADAGTHYVDCSPFAQKYSGRAATSRATGHIAWIAGAALASAAATSLLIDGADDGSLEPGTVGLASGLLGAGGIGIGGSIALHADARRSERVASDATAAALEPTTGERSRACVEALRD